jgi:hypothetical protein
MFIVRTRRLLTMRRLYRASSSGNGDEVLLWVPGGMPLMLHLEGAIAAALKLRGHKVHAVICDGVFSACVKREISDQVPISKWSETCASCRFACSQTLKQLDIPHSYVGDYVSANELVQAKAIAAQVQWNSVQLLSFQGVCIGSNIKSAVLRYLKGHERPTDARLLQEYAFSGLVCAASARNVFAKRSPARVIMSHGTYVDWGPALKTAISMKIPLVAWMASYLPCRFYFRHVPDAVHIDFHNMSDNAWDEVKRRELSEEESLQLNRFLSDRYTKNTSFDMKRFKPYIGQSEDILDYYRLDKKKPIWGIMAHINWDTVSDYAPMLYESFNEWISDTVDIAINIPSVQWLVKVHPAEAWDNADIGVESLIRMKFPSLPSNILLLPAEETISPLDFFSLVDGAVTVYGTAGLELAMHGKPVILAGDAHYGKKGFTLDPDSRDEYRRLLQKAGEIAALTETQVDLAKKYGHCYFLLRQIPVSAVESPDSKWWSFQFDKCESLLPGRDPAIDFICDRIVDGKDFIMSPWLEAETRNETNRK